MNRDSCIDSYYSSDLPCTRSPYNMYRLFYSEKVWKFTQDSYDRADGRMNGLNGLAICIDILLLLVVESSRKIHRLFVRQHQFIILTMTQLCPPRLLRMKQGRGTEKATCVKRTYPEDCRVTIDTAIAIGSTIQHHLPQSVVAMYNIHSLGISITS
jgi:hypothetical protein